MLSTVTAGIHSVLTAVDRRLFRLG